MVTLVDISENTIRYTNSKTFYQTKCKYKCVATFFINILKSTVAVTSDLKQVKRVPAPFVQSTIFFINRNHTPGPLSVLCLAFF